MLSHTLFLTWLFHIRTAFAWLESEQVSCCVKHGLCFPFQVPSFCLIYLFFLCFFLIFMVYLTM